MVVVSWASWNVITDDLPPPAEATEARAAATPADTRPEDYLPGLSATACREVDHSNGH